MMARKARRNRRNVADRTSWQPRGSTRRRISGRVIAAVILVLGLAGVIGYFVVFSPLFSVQDVSVTGAKTVDAGAVKRAALDASEQHFGPISSNSLALVDTGEVAKAIKRDHDDIAAVEVTASWPNRLNVDVTERQSTLLWQSKDKYYLVDAQGTAFDTARSDASLIKVEDSTGLPVELGKRVASSRFIKSLQDIQRDMKTAGFTVKGFRIPETTFEVQAITDKGYYAVFDTTRSASFQVDALKKATDQAKPSEYADLRVPGRVYVK
jgi:cell division septal protein FtsQ